MGLYWNHKHVRSLFHEEFRRLPGGKRGTFDKILKEAKRIKKTTGGRRNNLSLENPLFGFRKHPRCALPAGIAFEIILMDATKPLIERETD